MATIDIMLSMRKISTRAILFFISLYLCAVLTASTGIYFLSVYFFGQVIWNVFSLLGFLLLFFLMALVFYRAFLFFRPLTPGEIAPDSALQFTYDVYVLFYLMIFFFPLKSFFLPLPLRTLLVKALGARLGANTYPSGFVFDPPFVTIGKNAIIGFHSVLVPHVLEGNRLAHYPISIGDDVTIGGGSYILANTQIGDRAIVAANSVVPKGSRIGPGEIWGGTPAKKIGNVTPQT